MEKSTEDQIITKFKSLSSDTRKGLFKKMEEIIHPQARISERIQPLVVQISIEAIANQRNLAIISGSLATASIIMFGQIPSNRYIFIFVLAVIGLLFTTLIAVVDTYQNIENGSKNLNDQTKKELRPFDEKFQIIIDLILEKTDPQSADKKEEEINEGLLKELLRPRKEVISHFAIWQNISNASFVFSISALILYFLLSFVIGNEWFQVIISKIISLFNIHF